MRLALGAALLVGCHVPDSFTCTHDEQCGAGLRCEANNACSGLDPSCASGHRFDPSAASARGECTPPVTATHVAPNELAMFPDRVDVMWSGDVRIDTQALMIDPPLADGALFRAVMQTGAPSEVALLELGSLSSSAHVVVTGTRPLVIVAASDITITGYIDASASGAAPGPGASTQGAAGAGIESNVYDSGGGGGGFGTVGGAGGDAEDHGTVAGGSAGAAYGDAAITILVGGSPGGLPSPTCGVKPGAGGGAIQLSAGGTITIDGAISTGGGGGQGGGLGTGSAGCGNDSSGSGGGSGGAIFIEAAHVRGVGIVAANGGAGGSGASHGAMVVGIGGEPGFPRIDVAHGGPMQLGDSGAGGDGGWRDAPARPGANNTNAGGGGGAAGRIAIASPDVAETVQASPMWLMR